MPPRCLLGSPRGPWTARGLQRWRLRDRWATRSGRSSSAFARTVHNPCQVDPIGRTAGVPVGLQQAGRTVEQPCCPRGVPASCVRQCDAQLSEPLPQLALRRRCGLPLRFEDLVRGERATLSNQATSNRERLGWGQRLLGNRHDAGRTVRERTPELIPRPRLTGTASGVPVSRLSHGTHPASASSQSGPHLCQPRQHHAAAVTSRVRQRLTPAPVVEAADLRR